MAQPRSVPAERVTIPVVEERIDVGKEIVDVGRVRITTRTRERVEDIRPELSREEIVVERVPVNRYVDAPPGNRAEGDVLVVPVLEEVLVTQKRLLVREELRIRKTLVPIAGAPQRMTLRRQEVEVERIPIEGERGDADGSREDEEEERHHG